MKRKKRNLVQNTDSKGGKRSEIMEMEWRATAE